MPAERPTLDTGDLRQRYEAGESLGQIAASYGVTIGPVRTRLLRAGVPIRARSHSVELTAARRRAALSQEVVDRYAAGEGAGSIAASLHLSEGEKGVGRILRDAGVPVRGIADANRLGTRTYRDRYGVWLRPMHLSRFGQEEAQVLAWLDARDVSYVHQAIEGPYNVDIGIGAVAVEIHRYSANPLSAHCEEVWSLTSRLEYLLNRGRWVLYLWSTPGVPLGEVVADEIVAFMQLANRDPSAPSEYRVIRGCGELVFSGTDAYQFAGVPAPCHTRHRRGLDRHPSG